MTGSDHGHASTYTNWGCRCERCRAAYRRYRKVRLLVALRQAQA